MSSISKDDLSNAPSPQPPSGAPGGPPEWTPPASAGTSRVGTAPAPPPGAPGDAPEEAPPVTRPLADGRVAFEDPDPVSPIVWGARPPEGAPAGLPPKRSPAQQAPAEAEGADQSGGGNAVGSPQGFEDDSALPRPSWRRASLQSSFRAQGQAVDRFNKAFMDHLDNDLTVR